MNKSAIAAMLLIASSAASAFDVDGFHSGMTPADVAAIAQRQGAEAWEYQPGMWATGIRSQYRIDGTFSFCASTGLVSYSRSLDPDADYLPTVERTLSALGQPKVTVRRGPNPGPGGGDVQSIDLLWAHDRTSEILISLIPEGRDGKGALRYNRAASVSYLDRTRLCPAH
jgi:hypothetical protein